MFEKLKENSIDFFKSSHIEVKQDSSNFVKVSAMALFTLKKTLTIQALKFIGIITFIIFSMSIILTMISGINQKFLLQNAENLKQERIEQIALDKKNASKKQMLYQNIEKLTQEDINKTISFINSVEQQQINQLVNLYWSMVYLKENKQNIDMKVVNSKIKKSINFVQNHYAERRKEVLETYGFIKNKQYDAITNSYDKQDSVIILNNWITFQRLGKIEPLQSINELSSDWMQLIDNPRELIKYLEENKDTIEKSKSFLID